ncbi:hypothetical protein R3P38DRAFT_2763046 [Favolaschia claudopus]|uniref:Uncharacterized protein n=1 Tax=Favolaschia claudopus TaxID=2862362 RepID=A0AAW0DMG6_9AGAR
MPFMLPLHSSDCDSELYAIHHRFARKRPGVTLWADYRALWVFREGGYVRRTAIAEPYIFECWLRGTAAKPVIPRPTLEDWESSSAGGGGWGAGDGSDGEGDGSDGEGWGVSSTWDGGWGGAVWGGGGGWSYEEAPDGGGDWRRCRSLTSYGWITWRNLDWDGIARVPKSRGKKKRQRQRKAAKRAAEAAAAALRAAKAAEVTKAVQRNARIALEAYLDKYPTPECC